MGGIGSADPGVRASIAAGASAFGLSIVVALFSRIPFGTMLLRALALGIGFALAAYGAVALLKRFLPELFEDYVPAPASDEPGGRVNIVLPEGDAYESRAAKRPVDDVEPLDERQIRDDGFAAQAGVPPAGAGYDGAGSAVHSPSAEPSALSASEAELESLREEVKAIRDEDLVPAQAAPRPTAPGGPRPSVGVDELDVLPDLDSLSDSFIAPIGDAQDEEGFAGRPSPSGGGGGGGDAGDAAVMAKAIQTILRRDQKG
jgi:hypothetical protein